jgi:D-alanyl-D-alanine dipeptidase
MRSLRFISKNHSLKASMPTHFVKFMALSEQRVTSVQTSDGGEAMVPIQGIEPRLLIDETAANIAGLGYVPEFLVRQSVADKLIVAAQTLPNNLHLLVKETLRPLSFQKFIFNRRLDRLATERPELQEGQLVELTSKFIAPPWVAGHPTGGAFDVTVCHDNGQEVEMGCAYDEDEKASQGRCFSFAENLTEQAKQNRNTLFDCLTRQGFVNYPFEWWHWSYGDKYWAAVTNSPFALYGTVG